MYVFPLIFEHYVLNLLFDIQKNYLLCLLRFIDTSVFTIIIFVYAILSFLFYQRNINN